MDTKRKGLIAALALGLISGPAVALGAAGVLTGDAVAEAVASPAPVVVTAEAIPAAEAGTTFDADIDLQTACLVDGQSLVAAEADETITDVEQAALEALRDICGAAGMSLADAPAAEMAEEVVVVRTVTVSASAAGHGDEEPDDEYEGHDEYEDEDEDDDEHEDRDDEDEDE